MYHSRKAVLLLLSGLAACGGQGGVPPERRVAHAEAAVEMFAQSCVAAGGEAGRVAQWAQENRLQRLNESAVKKLPLGMMEWDAQAVWRAERGGAVFYVSTGGGGCSVKTAVADEAAVRKAFAALAERGGAKPRASRAVVSPLPFNQLVYAHYENGAGEETLLTANTSPSEQVPAQAALFFTRKPLPLRGVSDDLGG